VPPYKKRPNEHYVHRVFFYMLSGYTRYFGSLLLSLTQDFVCG
jgi:hypothetical protein